MINSKILVEAIENQNDRLKTQIRDNERLIDEVEKWVAHINLWVETAKEFFDIVTVPTAELVHDPETGDPHVIINVYAKGTHQELHERYKKCVKAVIKNEDKDFMFRYKTLLDVNQAHLFFEKMKDLKPK